MSPYIPTDDELIKLDPDNGRPNIPIIPNAGYSKDEIKKMLQEIGEYFGYIVEDEINTGFSKVDMVWFDNRIQPIWLQKKKFLESSLAIPIMGFEIEEKSDVRKVIRGDIDSLNSLAPSVGIIVFSDRIKNITLYNAMKKDVKSRHPNYDEEKIQSEAIRRTQSHWRTSINTFLKFTAASYRCRIVLWQEKDLNDIYAAVQKKKKGIV